MTTARYPKDVLLKRIDERIASIGDRQAAEEESANSKARKFIDDVFKADYPLETALEALATARGKLTDALVAENRNQANLLSAARRVCNAAEQVYRSQPSSGWWMNDYAEEYKKIARRYEVERIDLEGKRRIIEAADAPDGFTLTALEKLHLLDAVR